ncbi:AAA family ATPase [Natronomonas salina]|uniref:DEAD/DEAH box helicase n=1 Tax=Natronomonas salina TaxID=1710540 RepID=UPI0015B47CCF|nr:AAA domain-containing protein [Natronomonas salina]QLD90535.1 AAA family ATPase [Natronomonas salina]
MEGALDAVHSAFLGLNRRPAVFDREIREHVGEWTLAEPVPVEDIIGRFKQHPAFILEDSKVILPVHEPGSADLTGEFLLYYPDHVVPCVVYYDYAKDDLARIPIEEFERSYPAWRLRFWHGAFDPPAEPEYLVSGGNYDDVGGSASSEPVSSAAPLANDGEDLIEDLRSMITDQEIAARDDARNRCERLPPAQFLQDRGGVEGLVTAGIDVDEYGQQVVRLRIPKEDLDGPVDITDDYGVYPGSEVLVDSLDGHEGFPAEAEVLGTEGRELRLSFYWDRGADNPDISVFELDSDARFLAGELLNPVPFDRKREAVDLVGANDRKRGWLSGSATMSFDDGFDVSVSKARLNKFQYQAAHSALSASDVFCIHGPPGTGKTRTLVEIIRAACEDGQRVLAVSHSNQAVDNLLVGDSTEDRIDRSSIHAAVEDGDLTAARAGGNTSNDLVDEAYVGNDLYQSDVVCATMSGSHRFGEDIFDLVVVDEATQATIPSTLIPLARGKRVVLAGDHKQLPPYHSGEHDEYEDVSVSMFEHLYDLYGEAIVGRLRTQYRMNEEIAAFPNEAFYDGELMHGQRNRSWTISPLAPLEAYHVEGEEEQAPSRSYYNEREAEVVGEELERLLQHGVAPEDVGVITPYSGQIGKIRAELSRIDGLDTGPVKIATVDSFQGSEREVIVVSFVRSNPEGFSGFLTFPTEGPRRLNVSLTRARRRCVLVGNFDTLRTRAPTKDPEESSADVYQDLYDHLSERDLLSNRG